MLKNLHLTNFRCLSNYTKYYFLQFLERKIQVNCYLTPIHMGGWKSLGVLNDCIALTGVAQ